MRVLEALGNAVPSAARWSHVADLSVGYMHKHTDEGILDGEPLFTTSTHDWGVISQFTPLDEFRNGGQHIAVRVAAGFADMNAGGQADDADNPVFRQRRAGIAARLDAGSAPVIHPFTAGLVPFVTVIASYDHVDHGYRSHVEYKTDGGGVELGFMKMLTLRAGRYSDPGSINDWTYGWGLALPFGALGGLSYDEARWPRSHDLDLDPLHRRQFAVWLDPLEVWRAVAGEGAPRVEK
jgi:hypothetical protein